MTDEEAANYNRCMYALGKAMGALSHIKWEGMKMAKTTGFPDFHGIAKEALDDLWPTLRDIWEFNNKQAGVANDPIDKYIPEAKQEE